MSGMNKVYLMGHLGSDPKLSISKKGKEFTRLNVATNKSYRNAEGLWDSKTEWHSVMVWGKRGELCTQRLKKGSKVMIEGALHSYESKDEKGEIQYHTTVTASNVEYFLPKTAKSDASGYTQRIIENVANA